jgi:ankyrin repeat protein
MALLIAVPVGLTWRAVRQERLNQSLIAAVKRNDDRAVVSLLDQGADANCRDEPLRKFSLWETLVQVLPGRKSQPSDTPTPLLIALEYRKELKLPDGELGLPPENLRLVGALLDHGAQVNHTGKDAWTPVCYALTGHKNATARLLLARGANANEPGLLTFAMSKDADNGTITALLDHGADVNQRDEKGQTALLMAVDAGRANVVRQLLNLHSDVTLSCHGVTPLAQALQGDTPVGRQIVRLLKAAGAKE